MEFSVAEIIAIGALILNVIVYFSRVPTKSDMKDLRNEISDLRSELRSEMSDLRKAFTDHLMYMHGESRQSSPDK